MISESSRKRSSRRSRPRPVIDQPMNTNDTPRPRSTGITCGVWNRPPTAGARSHTSPMQTRPITMPAVDAARTSSSLRSGFCTSAEASPIRAKYCPNSTTRFAIAISPNSVGPSRRETVAVKARLATTSATVDSADQLRPDAA